MTKIYLNPSPSRMVENVEPSEKCIEFLLSYSKALKVIDYKGLQFENFQN